MSVCYTIGSMIFLLIVFYLFFKRKGKLELENKVFLGLMVLAVILVFFEGLRTYYIGIESASNFIVQFVGKMDVFLMIAWQYLFLYYLYILSRLKVTDTNYYKKAKKLAIIFAVASVITLVLVIFAPLELYCDSNGLSAYSGGGALAFFLYFFTIVVYIFATVVLTVYKKNIRNIFLTPLYLDFETLIIVLILKIIFPNVLINILVPSFILTIVISYLTIESQDSRLLYDYRTTVANSEKNNKIQKEFLGNISRHLRTPMTSIVGFGDIISSNDNLSPEEMKKCMDYIYSSNKEVSDLIRNLVDISKIKSNREVVSNVAYSLDKLLFNIVSNYRKEYANSININVLADPNLPLNYIGDVVKINKIIKYIIDTAIRFDNYGHIDLSVQGTKINDSIYEMTFVVSNRESIMNETIFNAKFEDYANEGTTYVNLKLVTAKELTSFIGGVVEFTTTQDENANYYIRIRQRIYDKSVLGDIKERINLLNNKLGGE